MYTRLRLFSLSIVLATMLLPMTACNRHFAIVAPPAPKPVSQTYSNTSYNDDKKLYDTQTDPAKARQLRDKIVYSLMADIDNVYGNYTASLFAGKGVVGVVGDSTVLGLTAAATIATHTPTKTILSALGTALTGVNLSVDKNFFAQQTFQSIAVAMQTRRDKAKEFIIANLRKPVEEYPLAAAKRDLVAYFWAGTLPGGLQELQEEAGAAAREQSSRPAQSIH